MAQHSSPAAGSEGAPIEGVYSVHRVTYFNEETHYGVVHLVPADVPSVIGFAAVGTFPAEPRTGECYRIEGVWRRDPRHGLQVRASSIVRETPPQHRRHRALPRCASIEDSAPLCRAPW